MAPNRIPASHYDGSARKLRHPSDTSQERKERTRSNSPMILRTSLTLATLLPGSLLFAQGAPAAAPRMSDPPAAITAPSATMRPSLEILKSAMGMTNVDRWKASNANDVTNTLPSLLAAADAAPSSPAKVLPAYRNADALYDVLLRVVVSAHL